MTSQPEQWFAFRAYNTQTQYGFGTADQADRYVDHLNDDREINVYVACPVTDAEAEAQKLDDSSEAFSLDDTLREIANA